MTHRYPTKEERALWRATNRHTERVRDEECLEDCSGVAPAAKAAPTSIASAAPSPVTARAAKKIPSPLSALPRREADRLLKSSAPVAATLDLHGLGKVEAYTRVTRFLQEQHRAGARHVLIITGKGRIGDGVLRTSLPHWLNEPEMRPLVAGFAHARPEKGGSGVCHVLLSKRHG